MFEKLRKKFIIITLLSVFALLAVLLSVINVTNFTLVASDADEVTQTLVESGGSFGEGQTGGMPPQSGMGQGGFVPGGPSSPETSSSTRYFAYEFDESGSARLIAFRVSALSETDAESVARSLLTANNKTGWVNSYYRYRVETNGNRTTVVVIDEARELRPSYQVLYISVFGSLIGILVTFLVLIPISKRIIKPLEEANDRQKRFISDAARELKVPITVLYANNSVGEISEEVKTSNVKQLKKMGKLVDDLDSLLMFDKPKAIAYENMDIAEISSTLLSSYETSFEKKGIEVIKSYPDSLTFSFNENMLKKLLVEVFENGLKYSKTFFEVKIEVNEDRLSIETINDADGLPEGDLDRVFERFYRLPSSVKGENGGNGVGLAIVKEIVDSNGGRYSAKCSEGKFRLKVDF